MQPYRQALVCGLGGSGGGAARLLKSEGTDVTAVDRADTPELRRQAADLEREGVHVRLGCGELPSAPFDVCIISPGIPPASPWMRALAGRGVPVLSELELGWSRRSGRGIAVTGSNGKSTAVKWLAESLCRAGYRAAPGGNYGHAVSSLVLDEPGLDWMVLEVSSFQLETVRAFRADAGILLNIHPNHLDRHGDMATYTRMKARLFDRTEPADACVVFEPVLRDIRLLSPGKGRWLSFGASETAEYRYRDGIVARGASECADFRGTHFGNDILGLAAAAGVAALEAVGVDARHAVAAAREFRPLPHRMELIAESNGVRYINDSKATNLSAMAAALRMLPGNVRLIAGGLVKENDFSFVKEVLAQKVAGVYLIGQAANQMYSAWTAVAPCFLCETLAGAVARVKADARAGDTVLLSPACASYDQFRNFEERGECFGRLVREAL